MIPVLREHFFRPMRCERGNVLIMVSLMAFLLILAVGVAVDMARAQILQQRISASLDAAGLAAAETVSSPPSGVTNQDWAEQQAQRFFYANFPAGYLGSSNITCCSVAFPNNDLNTLTLSASASQSTAFMQTFGVNTLSVGAVSQVSRGNGSEGLEVVLVLDNTGSMNGPLPGQSGTKLSALTLAVNELITILFGNNGSVPNLYMGIVPFSESVSVPSSLQNGSWMDPGDPNAPGSANWLGMTWQGCLSARSSSTNSSSDPAVSFTFNGASTTMNMTLDISDDPPSAAAFDAYYWSPNTPSYTDPTGYYQSLYYNSPSAPAYPAPNIATSSGYVNFNPWAPFAGALVVDSTYSATPYAGVPVFNNQYNSELGDFMGPNAYCAPAVLPMTASKSAITTYTSNLSTIPAAGNTMINLGLAWAWRMLSPNWRGLWNSADMLNNNLPLAYNSANSQKVVILLTDGTNLTTPGVYSAYGFLSDGNVGGTTSDPQAASLDLDSRTLATCQSLKNNNITVFTIGFGNPTPDTVPTLADRRNPTLVDVPLLQACATTPNYFFLAPTYGALQSAFQQIGNTIMNIHVSK